MKKHFITWFWSNPVTNASIVVSILAVVLIVLIGIFVRTPSRTEEIVKPSYVEKEISPYIPPVKKTPSYTPPKKKPAMSKKQQCDDFIDCLEDDIELSEDLKYSLSYCKREKKDMTLSKEELEECVKSDPISGSGLTEEEQKYRDWGLRNPKECITYVDCFYKLMLTQSYTDFQIQESCIEYHEIKESRNKLNSCLDEFIKILNSE